MMFTSLFIFAVTLSVIAAQELECAYVPLEAQYWAAAASGSIRNNVEQALVLGFQGDANVAEFAFSTSFEEAQDLTQHSVLSFNLYKVVQPSAVYVSLVTPHGTYRTPLARLFERKNTITVDLSTNEFASLVNVDEETGAAVFDEPIVGLSAVSHIAVHLVADSNESGQVTLDSMMLCASSDVSSQNARLEDLLAEQQASAQESLDFPDVASLSEALTTALAEVQRMAAEVESTRVQQRQNERAFEEFAQSVRSSIDTAVQALSSAVSANVEQTLSNNKLLQRVRERLGVTAESHSARLDQLAASFDALKDLAVHQGEKLADTVHRTISEHAQKDAEQLRKRAVAAEEARDQIKADIVANAEKRVVEPVVAEAFGHSIKKINKKAKIQAPSL